MMDLHSAHRELAKWLNEEQTKPIDRQALATVLWAVNPQNQEQLLQRIAEFGELQNQVDADLTDAEILAAIAASPTEDHTKEGWIRRQRIVWCRAVLAAQKGKQ